MTILPDIASDFKNFVDIAGHQQYDAIQLTDRLRDRRWYGHFDDLEVATDI
jgi:hypothetical protein